MVSPGFRASAVVPAAGLSTSFRLGLLLLDVPARRLHLLNEAARQLHREGLPLQGAEPALAALRTLAGEPVCADDLPLVAAAREARSVEAAFELRQPGKPAWLVLWSATPLRDQAGQLASVHAAVCCTPPSPDWQTLAGLSHDLRTPLQTLNTLLTVLEAQPANGQQALDRLRNTAGRALDVASDLLEWCQLPAQGGRRLDSVWLPLEALLLKLIEEQRPVAGQKGLTLDAALGDLQNWEIYSDRVRLGRLLMNLLGNAVRYTPPGGRVTLTAAWREEAGERLLVLGVADTGTGIPVEEQESIFQAYERGRAGREGDSSGSGLGLTIVDRLATALGLGRELVSEHGRGSIFRVLVPLRLLRLAPPAA